MRVSPAQFMGPVTAVAVAFALSSACVKAGDVPEPPGTHWKRFFCNTPQEPAEPRVEPDSWERHVRAGHPLCIAPWAQPSFGPRYWGYYVGGGAPFHGEPRYAACEGTWGWDYDPWYSRVRLRWWHGRYQGGEGQYEPNAHNNPAYAPLNFTPRD